MTMLDLRGITGREIRGSDVAIGFDGGDGTVTAGRKSTWTIVLELLGIHIQFAQSDSGPWSSSSTNATHFRIATGVTQPGDSSTRWSAAIPLGQGTLSFADITGMIADNQIPASIMRDAEFTAAAVRGLLGLTAQEVDDLFTGANIVGQTLTFTQNDGSTVSVAIPAAQAGTGDGVVQSGDISGTDLVLTLDTGGMITIDIDELAFDTELTAFQTAAQVQALITAAVANFQTAAQVQTLINATALSALQGMVTNAQIPAAIARLASPALTGDPTAPTPASGDDDTSIATTAFVVAGFATLTALNALTARVAALESGGMTHTGTRYAALRPSGAMPADFTEADFLGANATTSTTGDIYTPASNDDMVVGLAVPSSEGTLTALVEIDVNGDENPFGHTRSDILPNLGTADVTLDISGEEHYIYCTDAIVRGLFLGVIGFRMTQA